MESEIGSRSNAVSRSISNYPETLCCSKRINTAYCAIFKADASQPHPHEFFSMYEMKFSHFAWVYHSSQILGYTDPMMTIKHCRAKKILTGVPTEKQGGVFRSAVWASGDLVHCRKPSRHGFEARMRRRSLAWEVCKDRGWNMMGCRNVIAPII